MPAAFQPACLGPEPRDKTIKLLSDFFAKHPWRNPMDPVDLQTIRKKLVFDDAGEDLKAADPVPAPKPQETEVKTEASKAVVKTEVGGEPAASKLLASIVIDLDDGDDDGELESSQALATAACQCQMCNFFTLLQLYMSCLIGRGS